MEYIYLIIGIVVLVLAVIELILTLTKIRKENNTVENLSKIEVNVIKELGEFKDNINSKMYENFTNQNKVMEDKLHLINDAVNERLDKNFEKTNKTFANVLERLSKIDEAQKKIDNLSGDIVSLQGVLTDKKSRGIFGEVNLKNILVNVFGEGNDKIYRLQYKLENGTIVDSALFAPEPLGLIGIDSKFPLENYRRMVDKNLSIDLREKATKLFKADIKNHINAIADKYIIDGVTSDQAIMFLPAEALFAEINAYHPDIIEYAYKKRVWLTSPTTLMSTLTTIQVIMKNMERDKYTSVIHNELKLLDVEFKRYKDRWDKLSRSIDTVTKDVKDINTTTDKISKKFDAINQVEVETIEYEQ